MERSISGFLRDAEGDWVARLDCGHGRHVRHDPPFTERAWTLSEAERAARIGERFDCVRCTRREWPDGFGAYQRTRTFDAASVPAGLRARHTTKAGIWARIHVLEGRLRYRIHAPFDEEEVLLPGRIGVVLPGVEHEVEPVGELSFYVEFHRAAREAEPRSE